MIDEMNPELTAEERAELTSLHAMAFRLKMDEAKARGQIIPCWLCTDEAVKKEMVASFLKYLSETTSALIPHTEQTATRMIESVPVVATYVQQWRLAEAEMKRHRAKGNPRAFFAEY